MTSLPRKKHSGELENKELNLEKNFEAALPMLFRASNNRTASNKGT